MPMVLKLFLTVLCRKQIIASSAQVAKPDMAFRDAVTFEIAVVGYANPVRPHLNVG
jgi:hypothetical protein